MAVQANLLPSHSVKTLGALKAERTVKRITFNPTEANPGNTLYVSEPKLNEQEVIVPGTLAPFLISILQVGMRTTISYKMFPEPSLTISL